MTWTWGYLLASDVLGPFQKFSSTFVNPPVLDIRFQASDAISVGARMSSPSLTNIAFALRLRMILQSIASSCIEVLLCVVVVLSPERDRELGSRCSFMASERHIYPRFLGAPDIAGKQERNGIVGAIG